ncbi:aldo/keto reductase [bacterium]|nr:MAG: aldo/keto reductase [bacterium]
MILNETFTLYNGVQIPKLGLGTWFISNEQVQQTVVDAVHLGYRHFDTAQAYQNEAGVGLGVKNAGVKREELFITTKLAAEIKSYDAAVASINQSLETLGLEYIDLMLIHSPKPWMEFHEDDSFFEGNLEAWRALEEAYKAGKLRSIGVSNFQKADIKNILKSASVKPMVNQVLAHISNTPFELIEYCKTEGILVQAYSPVAHGELLKNENVAKIAEKYKVTIAQLGIRYCLELGLLPLPKTANPAHLKNNADVDFQISAEDMEYLVNIDPIKDYGSASMFPVYGGRLK